MSLERDLMDLEESLMRNDDCVHQSDYYTIVGLANDAREIEQERDTLKEENEKLWERVYELEELTDHRRYIPQEWYATLKVENAKLRALVRDIERARKALCDELGHIDLSCDDCPACQTCDTLYERMRDLGIEVKA